MVTDQELAEAMALNESLARRWGYANYAEELVSSGNEAIVRAIEKFDRSKGIPFKVYAAYWIRRNQRRAYIDLVAGMHLPHDVSDYNKNTADLMTLEFKDEFKNTLLAPEQREESAIERALALLPASSRDIIEEVIIEKQNVRYVAKKLGLDRRSVYYRKEEALRQLKEVYETGRFTDIRSQRPPIKRRPLEATIPRIEAVLSEHKEGLSLIQLERLTGFSGNRLWNALNRKPGRFVSQGKRMGRRWYLIERGY
jgi:RNA polymerase sigma factor (sigma-70 family)